MANESNSSNVMESTVLVGFVLLAIVVIFAWLFFSIQNWSVRESIMDYKYEQKTSASFLQQLEYFRDKTYAMPTIRIGALFFDHFGAHYKLRVFSPKDKDALLTLEQTMFENIKKMAKYSKELAYVQTQKTNGRQLSSQQYKQLAKIEEHALSKVMPLRIAHSNTFDEINDLIHKIQKRAFAVYFFYLLPVLLTILIAVVMIGRKFFKPKSEVRVSKTPYEQYLEETVYPISLQPEIMAKPVWLNPYRPKMKKNWKSDEFAKKIIKLWEKAGVSMPALGGDITAYLLAHKDAPASINGHCAYKGGLIEHTTHVVEEALVLSKELEWGGFRLQLLLLSAMAHDIGKAETFFFYEAENKWFDSFAFHDKASGYILQSLPNFMRLPKDHRTALLLAIESRHCRGDIPNNFPAFSLTLFKALCRADDFAARKEVKIGNTHIDDICSVIIDQWPNIISSLNINGVTSGTHDGYYDAEQDLLIVGVSRLLKAIYKSIPQETIGHIPKKAPHDGPHPIWQGLAKHLIKNNHIRTNFELQLRNRHGKLYDEFVTIKPGNLGYFQIQHKSGVINDAVAMNITSYPTKLLQHWNILEKTSICFSAPKNKATDKAT